MKDLFGEKFEVYKARFACGYEPFFEIRKIFKSILTFKLSLFGQSI